VGYGQYATESAPQDIQWNFFTLTASQLAIVGNPVSVTANQGSSAAFRVIAGGTPAFAYQWYSNSVALVNGGTISGATNAILTINPVSPANGGTNSYYCVVTNVYGAVTSSPAGITVFASPAFTSVNPVTYTNPMTLFGGTNNGVTTYLGSSLSFSVAASGASPVTYYWLTNGLAVAHSNGTTFTYPHTSMNSPTNFTCIASNFIGTATNTWMAQYIPAPTAPYPQAVIADGAVGYWRLDETNNDPNNYNDGEICNDYISGNNGIYTNAYLFQPGYSYPGQAPGLTTDPNETSADFGYDFVNSSTANSIGTNLDFSASSNAEFTVSVWANGGYNYYGSEPVNGGIIVKGYYGAEEFALDDGSASASGCVRFMVRTAANSIIGASSAFQLGGNTSWNHLVGVCDESNGVISLYINGVLQAQAAVAPGSGLLPEGSAPITIAANPDPVTGVGTHQYDGGLDDAAIFPTAFSAGQVAQLFVSSGAGIPASLIPPMPVTNGVFEPFGTLTIPAVAYDTPPIGYYWTNLTTATVMGSGSTNVLANLNATLTFPNASTDLSGDTVELVVTNAYGSTNWVVTLFSPALPIPLDYTDPILYSNEFNGSSLLSIAGFANTAANVLVGGTNTTWVDALGTNDSGSLLGSGVSATTLGDSWLLPFTPHSGYVYTLNGVVTFWGNPASSAWVGLGFAQTIPTNATGGRFTDAPVGYDWEILTESSGNVQTLTGPGGSGQIVSTGGFTGNSPATHTAQVVLDTTGPLWTDTWYVDGVQMGQSYTYSANPPIGAVGITQDPITTPGDIEWDTFMLTQYAPGGVPPYLLAPVPPTNNVLLTSGTVTIPVTAFGSAPLGFYWSDNSTIIASGLTNSMAPLPANLSVASSSLSAGQLQLVVTNAYGTNTTLITLISPPGPIQFSLTGSQLTLGWPTNLGWTLQVQTNKLSTGLGTNWVNVPGSTILTNMIVPISPTNGSVFYRLRY
jgi:hypothetical protein